MFYQVLKISKSRTFLANVKNVSSILRKPHGLFGQPHIYEKHAIPWQRKKRVLSAFPWPLIFSDGPVVKHSKILRYTVRRQRRGGDCHGVNRDQCRCSFQAPSVSAGVRSDWHRRVGDRQEDVAVHSERSAPAVRPPGAASPLRPPGGPPSRSEPRGDRGSLQRRSRRCWSQGRKRTPHPPPCRSGQGRGS